MGIYKCAVCGKTFDSMREAMQHTALCEGKATNQRENEETSK